MPPVPMLTAPGGQENAAVATFNPGPASTRSRGGGAADAFHRLASTFTHELLATEQESARTRNPTALWSGHLPEGVAPIAAAPHLV